MSTPITLITEWGTLQFNRREDIKSAINALREKRKKIKEDERWRDIVSNQYDFLAAADNLSRDAIENNTDDYIYAEIIFEAFLDERDRDPKWEFRRFCHYIYIGKKYRVEGWDFAYGFDMHSVEWVGSEEEYGSEFKKVKASALVNIMCTPDELAGREIHN